MIAAAFALALGACGDSSNSDVRALFEVPRTGQPPDSGFYALPYPNDFRVDHATGEIDLADHIRPNELIGEYIDTIAANQRGFSVNAASFVRFEGAIDPASLPQSPADSVTDSASVYLVDVDPDSGTRGEKVPVKLRFEPFAGEAIGENWLSVLPYPGFPLRDGTTYAVVVTSRVAAEDGSPVAAGPDMIAISSTEMPADPDLARAQMLYQPLWDYLDETGGDERADVAAASVFTTQNATELMGKIREVVRNEFAVPAPREIVLVDDNSEYVLYDGLYDGPNFQTGDVPYMQSGGEIVVDADGKPVVQRTEQLRFSFSVPAGEMPADGWPVVIYAHGTGGSYHSFRGRSAVLAAQGLAIIGVDQVLHGPRNPGRSPEVSFFNFQNPMAARFNTLQGALDNYQLVRLAETFDFTEPGAGGRTVRFDPDRIYFFGHSQGGLTGPPFLAHEPAIDGAVLSGAGGLIYLSLLLKTEPIDISAIIGGFVRDFPLDEFNNVLALVQGWIDISDPASYARYLAREPLPGVTAKHIFQSEGFTDRFTPLPSIEALATALSAEQVGPVITPIEGLELRGSEVLSAPVSGNLNGVTSVLLQYEEASGSDGHFVVFDVPAARQQSAEFLGSLARDGVATLPAVE